MRAIERIGAKRGALGLALLLGWCWWSGCSEVRDDAALPSGPVAKVHVDGWADLQTGQFLHAEEVKGKYKGSTSFCQRCHGEDYLGNGDAARSCFSCHTDPAKGVIHPAGWADLNTGQFLHAQALEKNQDNTAACQGCHGTNYDGGIAEVSCRTCHTDPAKGVIHPAGWADLSTGQFLHAGQIRQNGGSTATCQGCHGANYDGGIAEVSCRTCHADPGQGLIHPDGWLNPAAKETFHGEALRARNFDMSGCQSCHGADYAGGIVQTSCLTCHAGTPEGCTTCHGSSDNLAPPKDTRGNRETVFFGVGAHQTHLRQGSLTAALNCTDCHAFPQGFADPAHIDGDGRAELTFGARASANGSAPVYDLQANTCAGTYCHSGGRMGNNAAPVWTEVGSGQAACGTCHSLPPGEDSGHPQVALACSICHSSVVDADNIIIDTTKHINGQTDF